MRRILVLVALSIVLAGLSAVLAEAQVTCRPDGFGGTRCSDGSGWRSDGFGGYRGTGDNSGSGWRSDGFGGFRGILVPLFFFISCHGFVLPNTTAMAMAPHGQVAGSASALLGTFQFVLGAVGGSLVGAFANGTPVPMAVVVAGCGTTAFLTNRFLTT